MANVTYDGSVHTWGAAPLGAYEGLKTANTHIKNTATVDWGGDHLLTVGEKKINKKGHYISEEFLTMFEFPFVAGNAAQSMTEPGYIAISESTAKALFGDRDPIALHEHVVPPSGRTPRPIPPARRSSAGGDCRPSL